MTTLVLRDEPRVSSALTLWWPESGLLCPGTVLKSSSAAVSNHLLMAIAHTCLRTEGSKGGTGIGPWMGLYRTVTTSPIVSIPIQGLSADDPADGGLVPKSPDLELQARVLVSLSVGIHL